ncbi:hypothetical protein BJV74DRAFT_798016 [Russula compacta]|nr:hypothetical protein BJV74DRAFT_798016 [Russula compacta]
MRPHEICPGPSFRIQVCPWIKETQYSNLFAPGAHAQLRYGTFEISCYGTLPYRSTSGTGTRRVHVLVLRFARNSLVRGMMRGRPSSSVRGASSSDSDEATLSSSSNHTAASDASTKLDPRSMQRRGRRRGGRGLPLLERILLRSCLLLRMVRVPSSTPRGRKLPYCVGGIRARVGADTASKDKGIDGESGSNKFIGDGKDRRFDGSTSKASGRGRRVDDGDSMTSFLPKVVKQEQADNGDSTGSGWYAYYVVNNPASFGGSVYGGALSAPRWESRDAYMARSDDAVTVGGGGIVIVAFGRRLSNSN